MVLEQEIKVYMLIGFIAIWLFVGALLFHKWKQTRNQGILWFVGQFFFQCIDLFLFYNLLNYNKGLEGDLLSGSNSLTIGLMTFVWGISMVFMIAGVYSLSSDKGNISINHNAFKIK